MEGAGFRNAMLLHDADFMAFAETFLRRTFLRKYDERFSGNAATHIEVSVLRNRIDVFEIGKKYYYSKFQLIPVKLYHDVSNCGYRVFINNYKLIYCTDTYTLEGIKAIDYDFYLIEGNYENEEELKSYAKDSIYFDRVKNTHLSREYARNWLLDNMGLKSVYEFMHKHKYKEISDEEY